MSVPSMAGIIHEDLSRTADWVRRRGGVCADPLAVETGHETVFWVNTVDGRIPLDWCDWVVCNDLGQFLVLREGP